MSGALLRLLSRLLAVGACLMGGPGLCLAPPRAPQAELDEHVLKAKFLAKVCTFVDWPRGSTVHDSSPPFVIGILPGPPVDGGNRWEDPFVKVMQEVFRIDTLKNKKVSFKFITSSGEIKECQAIYVMPRARTGIKLLMPGAQPLHILVFGQTEGFAELGVHLNFQVVDRRVRFEINEASFQDSGLKLDALILRSAIVVKRKEPVPKPPHKEGKP